MVLVPVVSCQSPVLDAGVGEEKASDNVLEVVHYKWLTEGLVL